MVTLMGKCIFCEIINGEAEASIIYKNDYVTAFMDLFPINNGHVLIVPNQHAKKFTDIGCDLVSEMFKVAQRILKAIEKSEIKCEGANLFLSDGEVAGQDVFHSHLHVVPRFTGDAHRMGFSNTDAIEKTRNKLDEMAKMICNSLD